MACASQYQPWTAQEKEAFAALLGSGASGALIAEQLGRTLRAVWSKTKALGLSSARPIGGGVESAFWRENGDKALEMADAGIPTSEIGRRLGCTKNAVIGRLSREGESHPSTTFAERLASYPEPKGCRYIAGDVRRDGIHWCDAPITVFGRSYCDFHHEKCWSRREAES